MFVQLSYKQMQIHIPFSCSSLVCELWVYDQMCKSISFFFAVDALSNNRRPYWSALLSYAHIHHKPIPCGTGTAKERKKNRKHFTCQTFVVYAHVWRTNRLMNFNEQQKTVSAVRAIRFFLSFQRIAYAILLRS